MQKKIDFFCCVFFVGQFVSCDKHDFLKTIKSWQKLCNRKTSMNHNRVNCDVT